MRLLFYFSIFIVSSLLMTGCYNRDYRPMAEYSGYAQGTTYHIICDSSSGRMDNDIELLFKNLDHSISIWDSLSLVSQFNRSTNGIWVDNYFVDVFSISKRIYQETDGAFNPAIFPLLMLNDSIHKKQLPTDSLLRFTRFEDISVSRNDSTNGKVRFISKKYAKNGLTFEGIAQGYSVDIVCKLLDDKGIQNYQVGVGNEIRVKGNNPQGKAWKTIIDEPTAQGETRIVQSSIPILDNAISISGGYREFHEKDGKRYNNYIDPKTGKTTENTLLLAQVFAKTGAEADAYSTAFMVMGAGKTTQFLSQKRNMTAYLISAGFSNDFQTWMSPELEMLIEKSK